MKTTILCLTVVMCLVGSAKVLAHPFEQGQVRIAAGGGGGVGGWSAGVSAGYFVVEGLELGLGTAYISADDITLLQTTGSGTYVFLPEASFNPYVGGFARHWFVLEGDRDPQSSMGLRGGLYHLNQGGLMFGFGAAYEKILDCTSDENCTDIYPEFSLSLVF